MRGDSTNVPIPAARSRTRAGWALMILAAITVAVRLRRSPAQRAAQRAADLRCRSL